MTVSQMKEIINELPEDMAIVLKDENGNLLSVCYENSQVIELELRTDDFDYLDDTFVNDFLSEVDMEEIDNEQEDFEDEETEIMEVLLLVPCNHAHNEELELGEINSQPELN